MRLPRVIAVLAAGAALAGVSAIPASAGTTRRPSPLEVSAGPIRQLVSGRLAGAVPVSFELHDIGTAAVVVTAYSAAFAQTSTGRMIPASPLPGEEHWLQLPAQPFLVQVNQTVTVHGHLVLPAHAQPGDADLAAAFTVRLASEVPGTGATTVPVVLSELIAHVPGKASKHLIYSLHAGGLSWGSPVSVTATAHEAGNVYALLNHQAVTSGHERADLPGMLLLAGSTRTVDVSWQPAAFCMPCVIHYGPASADVWSLPGLPVLAIVLTLAGGTGVFLFYRRNHRKAVSRRHGPKPFGGPALKGNHAR